MTEQQRVVVALTGSSGATGKYEMDADEADRLKADLLANLDTGQYRFYDDKKEASLLLRLGSVVAIAVTPKSSPKTGSVGLVQGSTRRE